MTNRIPEKPPFIRLGVPTRKPVPDEPRGESTPVTGAGGGARGADATQARDLVQEMPTASPGASTTRKQVCSLIMVMCHA